MKMHKHMVCDIDESVELTTLPEKITVIYPTSAAPIECLLWSTFSLLLRTNVKDYMEHFMVCINGPDRRTGDPSMQDLKQRFLEDLRRLKWYHADKPEDKRDMPLSVIRVWSRIGHPESVEMAIPWVHTDSYLIMHDDIIIERHNWLREVENKFYSNPNAIIGYCAPLKLMCCQCDSATHQNKYLLRFPHLLCAFLVCRTKYMYKLGSSWCGYHIESKDFRIEDKVGNVDEFMDYYSKLKLLNNPPQTKEPYNYYSMEMGAWHFYNAIQNGYDFVPLDIPITHFGAMSWEVDTGKRKRITCNMGIVRALEKEIYAHPEYSKLYDKYLPEEYKS